MNPFPSEVLRVGPLVITDTVLTTLLVSTVLVVGLRVAMGSARHRYVVELAYEALETQVRDMTAIDVRPLLPLILTQWLFIGGANLLSTIQVLLAQFVCRRRLVGKQPSPDRCDRGAARRRCCARVDTRPEPWKQHSMQRQWRAQVPLPTRRRWLGGGHLRSHPRHNRSVGCWSDGTQLRRVVRSDCTGTV